MRSRDLMSWMWGDALSLLQQAERLHQQFFRAAPGGGPCLEPPVDIVESAEAMTVYVALPGVPAAAIVVAFEPGGVTISGERRIPASRSVHIHRLEIPYGRFERRIPLPLHLLEPAPPQLVDGCLILTLKKLREAP